MPLPAPLDTVFPSVMFDVYVYRIHNYGQHENVGWSLDACVSI